MAVPTLDEFLAQEQPAGGTGSIDTAKTPLSLDAFLDAHGASVPAEASTETPKADPGIATAFGNAVSKGLSVGGFGRDLGPFLSAAFPSEMDKINGSTYTDRLLRDKAMQDKSLIETEAAHPYLSGITQLAASVPQTIALAGALDKKKVATSIAAASIGGLQGLTNSKKTSIEETAKDTAFGSLVGWGVSKVLGGLGSALKSSAKEAGVDLASQVDEWGNIISANRKPLISKPGDDVLKIQWDPSAKDALEVGRDMQVALTSSAGKEEVANVANQQPKIIKDLVTSVKDKLGQQRAPLLEQYGDVRMSAEQSDEILNKAFKDINDIKISTGDPRGGEIKQELLNEISNLVQGARDPITNSGKLSLKNLVEFQQNFGRSVFSDKLYSDHPTMQGAAKKLWGEMVDSATLLDKTSGSGGKIGDINKVFKGIYNMEANAPSGADIMNLKPGQATKQGYFDDFLSAWAEVPPPLRSQYAPEVQGYLNDTTQNGLTGAIKLARLKSIVEQSSGSGIKGLAANLPFSTPIRLNVANQIGSRIGPQAAPSAIPSLGQLPEPVKAGIAGSIGGLSSQGMQSNGTRQ